MKIVNRFLVIIGALVLLVSSLLLGILPRYFSSVLSSAAASLKSTAEGSGWVVVTGVCLVVVLVSAFVLWLEFRDPGHRAVIVDKVSGGETRVMIESIEQRLKFYLDSVGQVIEVNPQVRGKDRKVDLVLDVTTSPEVDIKTKGEELSGVARDVMEGKMGLRVGRLRVNIKVAPYPKTVTPPAKA